MRIRILRFLFPAVMAAAVMLAGCSQRQTSDDIVSVSIAPIKYFIDRLTDNQLEVNIMVPTGASHGTYSPTASQMQKLSDSKVYFRIGYLGYEQAFIRRLKEMNPAMREVNLSDYVELIRGETIDHGDHVHEGGIDPHIWLSPGVMLKLLPVLRDNLVELYPELREVILANYPTVVADMEILHQEMQELTETLTKRQFIIFHPALTYLARDYGLQQISIEHEGKEPSPGRLSRLIRDARAENVPIVFIQEEYDVRNAQLVAQETGAKVVSLNHMAYDWFGCMEELMIVFKENLR
jgi:zinc transport system substrate-binding protein